MCKGYVMFTREQHFIRMVQWSLSIKGTLNKGRLSNEDTVCSPNYIELCTTLPLNLGHLSVQDSQLGPSGVLYWVLPLCLLMIVKLSASDQ